MTTEAYTSRYSNVKNRDRPACYNIPPTDSQTQTVFTHGVFCGKRGGKSFLEVVRPDEKGKCPKDHKKCSKNTSPQNTICYPKDEDYACPITDIRFTSTKNETWEYYNNGYKELNIGWEGSNQFYLYFSKDHTDNLPITTTSVEATPCADPDNYSTSTLKSFYPLEIA